MNTYHMWFNLRESRKDLELAAAVKAYLDYLQSRGLIQSWSLSRRKFGFGPGTLGEFHCTVRTTNLAQLDDAFGLVATRDGEVESLHRPVYAMVTDFTAALYRDFPDAERVIAAPAR